MHCTQRVPTELRQGIVAWHLGIDCSGRRASVTDAKGISGPAQPTCGPPAPAQQGSPIFPPAWEKALGQHR